MKLGLCSVRNKNIYHKSRLESVCNVLQTIDLYLGKFFKISFCSFWNGKFPDFLTDQVWSNCQVYRYVVAV